ncbi:short transient receptor potential channel 5-like [Ptychodera flava]|uniref:short transient receptor potential channel 5-like n=1 Tax=Ptychodera flava TaxID=63121 RepID=UPI00396A94FE
MFIYEVEVDVTVEGSAVTLISDDNYLPILCLSIIFFATLSMIELSQLLSQGYTRYLQNHWNKLDLYILLSFFLSTIFVNPLIIGQLYGSPHIYVLCSKLTTITFVCAILRFAEPIYLTRYLGPMLIVVTKVVNSVIRFLLIFWLVVVAYALALYHLYADVGTSHEGLSELLTSIWVLLITIFGGDGSELLYTDDWMSMNVTGIQSSYTSFTSPYYSFVAYTLYSLFGILVLIILLNLCIAMMSYDYEKVRDKMELEWKFNRSGVWIEYINAKPVNVNLLSLVIDIVISTTIRLAGVKNGNSKGTQTTNKFELEVQNGKSIQEEKPSDSGQIGVNIFEGGNYDSRTHIAQNEDAQGNGDRKDILNTVKTEDLSFHELLEVLLKRYTDKHAKRLTAENTGK